MLVLSAVLVNGRPVQLGQDDVPQLLSNMTVQFANTAVVDGKVWAVAGTWTLPVVTIKTNR